MNNTTVKNKRIKFAIAAVFASLILLIGASLAFFTDNVTGSATGTAGTVEISIDTSKLSLLNGDGLDNFNPGDGRLIDISVTNEGNKSVDLRQTFQVTMAPVGSDPFTALPNDASTPMGWAIYAAADCTAVNGNYVPKTGTSPVAPTSNTTNADGSTTLVYVVPEVVLNGNPSDANAEVESGISTNKTVGQYVLVMIPASDNSYQGATVTLDIIAEAKQHRNTSSITDWTALQTATVTFGTTDVSVVPAK